MSNRPVLGVVMDPIQSIHPEKDTTLAILLEAQKKGFDLYYLELGDLYLQYGIAWGNSRSLSVFNDSRQWFLLSHPKPLPLDQFDVLLMRKDPPVNMQYIYATYILEHAEQNGALVINKPQSLRDANEKVFATLFPQCMPPSLVTSSKARIKAFMEEQGVIVLKPLDGMGGRNVVKCAEDDPNINVIIDLLTEQESRFVMAQRFIPEITQGDKRIFLVDGEPLPFGLLRIPAGEDFRGNLAAGGQGIGCELSKRDRWICSQLGPMLREKGLTVVGIDVIGEYLTEINVTSPTCLREIEKAFEINLAERILDCICEKLDG